MFEALRERLKQDIFEIEKRSDLSDDQKVEQIRHITSALCAGLAVQPIPFADIFVLTPIQAVMGFKIASIRRYPISEHSAAEVVREMAGLVGLGFGAQQFAIGLYKTVIPFLGAVTTIPLVYGLTYAMGGVMDYYFQQKAKNRPIDKSVVSRIWRHAKKQGEAEGRARKVEIARASKKNGDDDK